MRFKSNVMDENQMRRTLIRISHEIIEQNRFMDKIILAGLERRGVVIANEIAQIIKAVENETIPVVTINFSEDGKAPTVNTADLPFPLERANVIIVNDVLHTGRTIKAAMEALSAVGMPQTIQLAVLIDRGNRELPIGANFIGKTLFTTCDELVSVSVKSVDGASSVDLYSLND